MYIIHEIMHVIAMLDMSEIDSVQFMRRKPNHSELKDIKHPGRHKCTKTMRIQRLCNALAQHGPCSMKGRANLHVEGCERRMESCDLEEQHPQGPDV